MKYHANPEIVVEAHEIINIGTRNEVGMNLTLKCQETGERLHRVATNDMLARIEPKVGDYWVTQSDGYFYLNPKAVFESKYLPVGVKAGQE